MASSSRNSPISRVPYEILREIFINCLPRYRLRDRQPDVTIAPMLLCRICSSWRMVALTSPILWSHLFFRLSVAHQSNDFHDGIASDWIVPKNQYSFLMWWKKNQGSMAPSLLFEFDWEYDKGSKFLELELGPVEMTSFFEYISLACYFETESFYWCVLVERIKYGFPIVYPNPHTMAIFGYDGGGEPSFYYIRLAPLPPVFPALQRLSIDYDVLLYDIIPNSWSALTHISLINIAITLGFWSLLIRGIPDLQWGNFDITTLRRRDYIQPTKCTLLYLSTLFVSIHKIEEESAMNFPLSILFTELHLPALRNLSLSSDEELWRDHRAIPELYNVLHSTPIVTTLTLGCIFLSLESDKYSALIHPAIRDVEPVWKHAPHLVHLRLEVMHADNESQVQVEEAWNTLIENLCFRDNPWLNLDDSACLIQEITMVDKTDLDACSDSFKIFMSSVRKHIKKALNTNIVFQVVSESENPSAEELWE